jgi:hypothetical protein
MSDSSLSRRRVDGRDKPGHDGRGSETQPERGHPTAIAISTDNLFTKFRTCAIVFLMDELTVFPGSSEGDEIDMRVRRSGLELERIFFIRIACNPLKRLDSEK